MIGSECVCERALRSEEIREDAYVCMRENRESLELLPIASPVNLVLH